jgi:hypothetical protein
MGFGLGPIPVTVMWEWCDRHNFDPEVTAHAVVILRIVDAETLRRAASKK